MAGMNVLILVMTSLLITPIWKDIYAQLPSFRNETKVFVENGQMAALWLDMWFGSQTLADIFPALFSRALWPNASVTRVLLALRSL
jgi:hypothetical protein